MKNIVNNMDENIFADYSLDLDAIVNYCRANKSEVNNGGKNGECKKNNDFRQQEITNNYELNEEDSLALTQKVVHEVITPQETPVYDDVKVDLVTTIVKTVLEHKNKDDNAIPFLFALQTLKDSGFLKTTHKHEE